ncbi:MAG: CapA family protein [Paludibacteraceae bacterium]|nr:CapA family protein [Paludibacteraceae bacterium]
MKVLVASDFCPMLRVESLIEGGASSGVFTGIRPLVESADYSFINLECPVWDGASSPITKCGPHLKCSGKSVEALCELGFSCATLANNHIMDYGDASLMNTLNVLTEKNMEYVGAGRNLEEAGQILYKEIGGVTLAVINCCEHEFSIASENRAGANPIEPVRLFRAIREAKSKADYVLVIAHGGKEYYPLPTPRMQELYRFFVDAGADAVVNHHQHCYSGYECYKGSPIFYGLGNFCFDSQKRNSSWNEGYMVRLDFGGESVSFELIPFVQCDESPVVRLMEGEEIDGFEKKIRELNGQIEDPSRLKASFDKFARERGDAYLSVLYPYQNRVLLYLARKHLFPKFLQKKRLVRFLNYMDCESHRDLFSVYMNSFFTDKK